MITKKEIEKLKQQNEKIRKVALTKNLKDIILFGGMELHPEMDISLMDDKEITMAHLFTHNSFSLSKPKYGKDKISLFHDILVKEFKKREKRHHIVDVLDKIYK